MAAKYKFLGRFSALVCAAGLGWVGHDSGQSVGNHADGPAPVAFTLTAPSADAARGVSEPALPAPVQPGFESSAAVGCADGLMADWHRCDQSRWISSRWNSLLSDVVDPLFAQSDGWHFFNPDTLDGFRESVRRPASLSLAGGLKFSRSF